MLWGEPTEPSIRILQPIYLTDVSWVTVLDMASIHIIAAVALLTRLNNAIAAQTGLHSWMRIIGKQVKEAIANSFCLLL